MPKFYGAKLNINGNIFNQDFENIKFTQIPNKIKSFSTEENKHRFFRFKRSKVYDPKDEHWTMANIIEINGDILSGDILQVYNESVTRLIGARTQQVDSELANKNHFYYFIDDEIILVQSTAEVDYQTCIAVFNKLLMMDDENIGDLDFQVLSKSGEFENEIFSNTIRRITLKYVTPNEPQNLNRISDILQKNNAKKGKLEMENSTDGIKSTEENGSRSYIITDMLNIVKNGFGQVEARIGTSKNEHTIKTEDFPVNGNISKDNFDKGEKIVELKSKMLRQVRDDGNAKGKEIRR